MNADRIARAFVRLYPRAWRARYETELLALLDDSRPTWLTAFDIARGVVREWARAIVLCLGALATADDRSTVKLRRSSLLTTFCVVYGLVPGLAWQLGAHLDARGLTPPWGIPVLVLVLRASLYVRGLVALPTFLGREMPSSLVIDRIEFWSLVVVELMCATLGRWESLGSYRSPGAPELVSWYSFALSTTAPIGCIWCARLVRRTEMVS